MIKSEIKGALLAAGLVLGAAGSASAGVIQTTGSFDGAGNHLPELFGSIGATSLSDPNTINDKQIHGDQYWSVQASGSSVSTLTFEITANAAGLRFGVFDHANSANTVELFAGSASPGNGFGSTVTLTILGTGEVGVNGVSKAFFAGNEFGYYLQLPDNSFFYSDEALNPDLTDQMVSFQGNGTDQVTIPSFGTATFGVDEYFLAWEDILASRALGTETDNDYNDFVVLVESVEPVPEPGTLAVLGLGLLGLGVARRRMAKKA